MEPQHYIELLNIHLWIWTGPLARFWLVNALSSRPTHLVPFILGLARCWMGNVEWSAFYMLIKCKLSTHGHRPQVGLERDLEQWFGVWDDHCGDDLERIISNGYVVSTRVPTRGLEYGYTCTGTSRYAIGSRKEVWTSTLTSTRGVTRIILLQIAMSVPGILALSMASCFFGWCVVIQYQYTHTTDVLVLLSIASSC